MPITIGPRELLAALGGAPAWPLAARAQQGERMRRIGVLIQVAEGDPQARIEIAAFLRNLQQLGWSEGRIMDVTIDPQVPRRAALRERGARGNNHKRSRSN
jgi:hypothetical protein